MADSLIKQIICAVAIIAFFAAAVLGFLNLPLLTGALAAIAWVVTSYTSNLIKLIYAYRMLELALMDKNGYDVYADDRSWANPDDPFDGYSEESKHWKMETLRLSKSLGLHPL